MLALTSEECVHMIIHMMCRHLHIVTFCHVTEMRVALHILSQDHPQGSFMADGCSPRYMCPPQRVTH